MAKSGKCYFDRKGRAHLDLLKATAADIDDVLACGPRVTMSLLAHRAKIEAIFAEYDAELTSQTKPALGIIAGGRA